MQRSSDSKIPALIRLTNVETLKIERRVKNE